MCDVVRSKIRQRMWDDAAMQMLKRKYVGQHCQDFVGKWEKQNTRSFI